MEILIVDYMSYKQHCNFNKIHLEALQNQNHSLCLVGRKGQFDNITKNGKTSIVNIPEYLFLSLPFNPLFERLLGIFKIWWLLRHLNLKDYDAVVVLTYDILSLFVFRTSVPVILINHNNVSQLSSKIKLWLTRRLPKHYIHVALNEEMEERLCELIPDRIIKLIPHGICPPSPKLKKPSFVQQDENYIFCPVNSNYDNEFVKEIFESQKLSNYLDKTNQLLYLKPNMPIESESQRIIKINSKLTNEEYDYMIQNAQSIILIYGSNFKYRCSGIFFECVARNKTILSTNIKSMTIYKDRINNLYFFASVDDLIKALKEKQNNSFTNDLKSLDPIQYWSTILKNI